MRLISKIVLLAFLLAASTTIALACTCERSSNKEEIAVTDIIFTGTVTEKIQDTTYRPLQIEKLSPIMQQIVNTRKRYLVKFRIDKKFKGIDSDEITIVRYEQDNFFCPGILFDKGDKYLVYANKAENEINGGGICSRTQNFDKKSEDYRELLKMRLKS